MSGANCTAAKTTPASAEKIAIGRKQQQLPTFPFAQTEAHRFSKAGTQIQYNYMDLPSKISQNGAVLVKYTYLENTLRLNDEKNLIKLRAGFYGNHPAYSKWVRKEIERLFSEGPLKEDDINRVINKAIAEIGEAQIQCEAGLFKNMNRFFKHLINQ